MNEKAIKAIENIFRINLNVQKTERVLVFSDDFNDDLSRIGKEVADSGRAFTSDTHYLEYRTTGGHGVEPPEEAWSAAYGKGLVESLKQKELFSPLLDKSVTDSEVIEIEKIVEEHRHEAVNVVIALSNYSTSHTKFRDMLSRICSARYASMPLFDTQMLTGAMCVNWIEMQALTERITEVVNCHERIEINTPNGTSISFSKKGRDARSDTGIITEPGQFSNLPAGESYLAPLEGTAEGTLVLEWAPTRKLSSPIKLYIQKGIVTDIRGDEKYIDFLTEKLDERRENRNIAELGIGTNTSASRPYNILESEKIAGTIHIALGDNSSFGGKVRTSFHQDFVFFKPTVTLVSADGGKMVLLDGGRINDSITA